MDAVTASAKFGIINYLPLTVVVTVSINDISTTSEWDVAKMKQAISNLHKLYDDWQKQINEWKPKLKKFIDTVNEFKGKLENVYRKNIVSGAIKTAMDAVTFYSNQNSDAL